MRTHQNDFDSQKHMALRQTAKPSRTLIFAIAPYLLSLA
jgi:hypothetical protein